MEVNNELYAMIIQQIDSSIALVILLLVTHSQNKRIVACDERNNRTNERLLDIVERREERAHDS